MILLTNDRLVRTILKVLVRIVELEELNMTAIEDLNAAVSALQVEVGEAIAYLKELAQQLADAIAAGDPAAIEAAAQAITDQATLLDQAVNPPPPPPVEE